MIERADLVWQEIHWPRPLDATQALSLLHRLAADATRRPVIFEAIGSEGAVRYLLGTPAEQIRAIAQVIESQVPGSALSAIDVPPTTGGRTAQVRVRGQALSLKTDRPDQAARSILGALASARYRGEEALFQLILGPGISPRVGQARAADPTQSWFDLLAHGSRRPTSELAGRMRVKDNELGFHVIAVIGVTAESEGRRAALKQGLLAALRTVQAPGTRIELLAGRDIEVSALPRRGSLRLSSSEVLTLTGWPLQSDQLPGLPEPHPKLLRLTPNKLETERTFATTNAPGPGKPVGIGIADALFHTLVIGPTGSGKSTALLNLIVADMKANRSVIVIDPKADLVHDILDRIPAHRRDDVVVLDPTDSASVVGLNPLAVPGASPELVADGILEIFRDLFPSFFGPRTSDVLHASLLTLAHTKGATLTWLPRLLTDAQFRRHLTESLNDPDGLDSFWEQYEDLSERQQAQYIGPVLSRLRQFLLRPSLRRVLDQSEPRFAVADLFSKPRILLVPLNTGLLGNNSARLLGSLLVSQLWQLTLARTAVPQARRTPVSIYIDEAQEFLRLGHDLSDALARSRSLGVAWHVAHQYRDQMNSDMKAALDTNARNKIVFGLNVKDARELAAMAPGLTQEDFMALPQYTVYTHLMREGKSLGWISAHTLPPPPITSDPVDIVARSQARYGSSPDTNPSPSTKGTSRPLDAAPDAGAVPIGRKRRSDP